MITRADLIKLTGKRTTTEAFLSKLTELIEQGYECVPVADNIKCTKGESEITLPWALLYSGATAQKCSDGYYLEGLTGDDDEEYSVWVEFTYTGYASWDTHGRNPMRLHGRAFVVFTNTEYYCYFCETVEGERMSLEYQRQSELRAQLDAFFEIMQLTRKLVKNES